MLKYRLNLKMINEELYTQGMLPISLEHVSEIKISGISFKGKTLLYFAISSYVNNLWWLAGFGISIQSVPHLTFERLDFAPRNTDDPLHPKILPSPSLLS